MVITLLDLCMYYDFYMKKMLVVATRESLAFQCCINDNSSGRIFNFEGSGHIRLNKLFGWPNGNLFELQIEKIDPCTKNP